MENSIEQIDYAPKEDLVINASDIDKGEFYRHTYLHVASAVMVFIIVEGLMLKYIPQDFILSMMGGRGLWLFIIGLFWLGSMVSSKLSLSVNRSMQYAGLGLYILIEALLFLPMIYIALSMNGGAEVIEQAALLTGALFAGLTIIALTTKADLSFLRSFLVIGGFVSLGLIVAGAIFGFNLGLWFSVAMVVLAGGSILYQTQSLKYAYKPDQYVAASMQLFASVMLMFWYILRILMSRK